MEPFPIGVVHHKQADAFGGPCRNDDDIGIAVNDLSHLASQASVGLLNADRVSVESDCAMRYRDTGRGFTTDQRRKYLVASESSKQWDRQDDGPENWSGEQTSAELLGGDRLLH